ncbi:5'-nucleotidase, cytosolic III [Chamberlinius hualienensis]
MIRKLHEHGIPLTVISAGLGDLIVEAIDQQSSMTDNIKIVANFMEFNDSGVLVAFKNDTIHCCNKNETPVHHRELFKRLSGRTNAILIGDLLEDSDMLDAVTHLEYVLKIGFLNDNNFEFFAKFMQKFDIVVENDETLDVVNGILQKLF